jgi:hypothetical protein
MQQPVEQLVVRQEEEVILPLRDLDLRRTMDIMGVLTHNKTEGSNLLEIFSRQSQ